MAEKTNISWCDATWSPWYGCTQVSMGPQGACEGCYARHLTETRFKRAVFGGPGRGEGTRDVRADSAWKEPLRWSRNPARLIGAERAAAGERPLIFPSLCDPFDNHPALTEPRRRFFQLIRDTPHLTWMLLTKRPGMIVKLYTACQDIDAKALLGSADPDELATTPWPRNAGIMCTVVNQEEADRDIPKLLEAKRILRPAFAGVSMEPLLGPVNLMQIDLRPTGRAGAYHAEMVWTDALHGWRCRSDGGSPIAPVATVGLDFVTTGGETDQGAHKARPANPDWFRSLRDQCAEAGVPFDFKQHGDIIEHRQLGANGWQFTREVDGVRYGRLTQGDWDHQEPMFGGRDFPTEYPWPESTANPCMVRVGSKNDPCTLDGVEHRGKPRISVPA